MTSMAATDELVFVYTTLPDEATALDMARTLVEAKLAACCNLLGRTRSVYAWAGRIEDGYETPMLIKTRAALVEAVVARARATHPYETPCFVTLPLNSAHPPYLAWALAATEAQ